MTPEQRRKVDEIVGRARLATPTTGRAFFRGLGGANAQNDHAFGFQSQGQPADFVVAYCHGGGDQVRALRDAEFLARAREDVMLLVELLAAMCPIRTVSRLAAEDAHYDMSKCPSCCRPARWSRYRLDDPFSDYRIEHRQESTP